MTTLGTGINYVGGSESSGTFAPQVNYRDRLEHGPTDSLELAYASHPWMTAVVAAYLSHTHWLRPSTVSTLRQTALELFPGAQISFRLHTDPDEGWNKLVMDVETGIGDIEMRIASEDAFYARLEDSPSLRDSLNDLVIAFA